MDKDKLVEYIIAFESGELEEDQVIDLFQHLVDSKLAWSLQGSYGRIAANLLELGIIKESVNVG